MAQEFDYIALRRCTVQELDGDGNPVPPGEDGRPITRVCEPGDSIPEARHWKNLWREVRQGRVGLAGTPLAGPALADSMRRQITPGATPERGREARASRRRKRAATAGEAAVARATGEAPNLEDPARDSGGRFASPEAEPEAEPEAQPEE
jgi:hypothetical protein